MKYFTPVTQLWSRKISTKPRKNGKEEGIPMCALYERMCENIESGKMTLGLEVEKKARSFITDRLCERDGQIL